MNDILTLKGEFHSKSSTGRPGAGVLPSGGKVSSEHLTDLIQNLNDIKNYWIHDRTLEGNALISVYYRQIVAKSNRIQELLKSSGKKSANDSIVGVKFSNDESPKHIITHFVSLKVIIRAIDKLNLCKDILNQQFGGYINREQLDEVNKKIILLKSEHIKKSAFSHVIADSYYADKFGIEKSEDSFNENAIVSIYKTNTSVKDILARIGLSILEAKG